MWAEVVCVCGVVGWLVVFRAKSIQGSNVDHPPCLPSQRVESCLGTNKERVTVPYSSWEEGQHWCPALAWWHCGLLRACREVVWATCLRTHPKAGVLLWGVTMECLLKWSGAHTLIIRKYFLWWFSNVFALFISVSYFFPCPLLVYSSSQPVSLPESLELLFACFAAITFFSLLFFSFLFQQSLIKTDVCSVWI